MYFIVLEWLDEEGPDCVSQHVIPCENGEVALKLYTAINRDNNVYRNFKCPQHAYIFEANMATDIIVNHPEMMFNYDFNHTGWNNSKCYICGEFNLQEKVKY